MAYVDALCTSYNTGFITFDQDTNLNTAILIFAHEVGHNVGASHDGDVGCNSRNFIMASHVSTTDTTFSQCSKNAFKSVLKKVAEVKPLSGDSRPGLSELISGAQPNVSFNGKQAAIPQQNK